MVNWRERIAIDLEVLGVQQVVKSTRLSVEFVVGLLAEAGRSSFGPAIADRAAHGITGAK